MKVTILTPTYNRAHTLNKCFESLCNQNCKEFIWLIIDDGSTDNTKEVVNKFLDITPFDIIYKYKENGGKHTALNTGIEMIKTELTFIVDSDDRLTPDAVEIINTTWNMIKDKNLCGINFLRGYSEDTVIGDKFPDSDVVDNGIKIQFNYNVKGDKAEVWRTDLLKTFPFPVYGDERFLGENIVWWKIALEYDMYYINKIIYITEYLDGGLSKSGRRLRINSPIGGMENSKVGMNKKFPLKERIKRTWLYIAYGFFANKSILEILKNEYFKITFINLPFGFALYKYWKFKYKD
ncbi:glycosyltransferase family 2 protein [Turicibacter bilis]|uniref:Glycosyltransferase family 2 protein n=1 Tax=Turicibacter bilis TaxID=2735723 RepID=A0ABY5JKA5_9FIRM|nr:glycosyltransferase family 2 protein [Turicibacter bilis]MBS3200930.1 glycosyltransferase family 2 protein [Turicibacter bilis]UUF07107.1 glycosyltransferase family 2 protein [Turicibacter bilis]